LLRATLAITLECAEYALDLPAAYAEYAENQDAPNTPNALKIDSGKNLLSVSGYIDGLYYSPV
jgi:hypothetical protein